MYKFNNPHFGQGALQVVVREQNRMAYMTEHKINKTNFKFLQINVHLYDFIISLGFK